MFRLRRRPETPSTTAHRGAVGSARVWDEQTRARRADPPSAGPAPLATLTPLELAGLVRAIAAATLEARLPECPAARRAELATELERRLLAAFEARAPEAIPRPRRTPVAPVLDTAATSREPKQASPQAPVEPAPPPRVAEPRARLLDLALEDRLGRLANPLAGRADLRARLVALALERLTRVASEPEASVEDLRNLDVLERRAAKLAQALAEANAALAYVASLEYVDPGEASIYRSVQGLALEDPRRAQKSAALERIFAANLALQKPAP